MVPENELEDELENIPLEDEISFWNGPFFDGDMLIFGGISDIEMKFWRLDFISHLEYSHVSRTNWRLDFD